MEQNQCQSNARQNKPNNERLQTPTWSNFEQKIYKLTILNVKRVKIDHGAEAHMIQSKYCDIEKAR